MVPEISNKTGRPLKPCKAGYVRNPVTNRCCKKTPANHRLTAKRPPNKPSVSRGSKKKTWKDVLKSWKAGKDLPKIKGSVFWETSAIKNGGDVEYKEKTKSARSELPIHMRSDSSSFSEYLDGKLGPVSFNNSGGTCTLVCPPDGSDQEFSHLGQFYKNASKNQISALWKKVAMEIEKMMKKHKTVYVSTHGKGIPWLHVRICKSPKYFVTNVLD
ncbi:FirrV-1-C7 [Feldmannia irregularis virus a]|uniref:FirrV-1-C7 n=1 Tax=Feldmannia irregularis virus a TaxID=231992 RepID=Q6XLX1_9PHYC|nr:FirrV-1-C7 [Feldmannia irregularis virus a]AAR26940.1 FirrV-1-C7 [Feldmannia irregularis virus a]